MRRFSTGERIVFLPYGAETYAKIQAWIREHGMFGEQRPAVELHDRGRWLNAGEDVGSTRDVAFVTSLSRYRVEGAGRVRNGCSAHGLRETSPQLGRSYH